MRYHPSPLRYHLASKLPVKSRPAAPDRPWSAGDPSPRHRPSRCNPCGPLLALLAACLLPLGVRAGDAPAAAAPGLSAAEKFFAPITFASAQLSPDGSKMCALTLFDDRHYALIMTELPSKRSKTLVRTGDISVLSFWWKSDDLLLVLIEDDAGVRRFQTLDLRAGKVNDLVELTAYQELQLENELPDEPEAMLFRAIYYNGNTNDIIRVNLRTGDVKKVVEDPGGIFYWLTNRKGEALAGWGQLVDQPFLLWRKQAADKWQRIDFPKKKLTDYLPFRLAPDQQRLIIQDFRGSSTARLCYFDPATGATEEIEPPGAIDPDQYQYWGRAKEIAAIVYNGNPRHMRFLNADAEAAYQWLSKALPDTDINFESFSRDNSLALVYAHNSRTPGVFCLVNFTTKKISALGISYPAVNPLKCAPTRPFGFTTSDGLKITGSVTLPAGVEKPPVVLIVGPNINGPIAGNVFSRVDQYFASRGYATVRINQRGTEKLGRDFAFAGDFQIATGMVRDLAEGLHWLDTQGWVDVKRTALFGESWGGLIAFQLAA